LARVEVVEARDLHEAGIGESKPYAIVKFKGDVASPNSHETNKVDHTLNPIWNSHLHFLITPECKSFEVIVRDTTIGPDEFLGKATVVRADEGKRHERSGGWLALEGGKSGTVQVFITEIALEGGLGELRGTKAERLALGADAKEVENELNLFEISIIGAKDLKGAGFFGKPDVYAEIVFPGLKDEQTVLPSNDIGLRTITVEGSNSPEWNTNFHYIITPNVTKFTVKLMQKRFLGIKQIGQVDVIIEKLNQVVDTDFANEKGKGSVHIQHVRHPLKYLFDDVPAE